MMTGRDAIWTNLSHDEHEFQYNPQKAFPDFASSRLNREPVNTRALAELDRVADIAFGEHPLHRLDLYRAAGAGPHPVHAFFHGGYWRAQDKANFACIAPMLVERGVTVAIMNYELCPGSSLDGVADSALAGVEWLHRNVADHGGDPMRISLSGHSAGAHLVAEALAADWPAIGIDPAFIVGAVPVSGIFDPAPARLTSVNAELRLDDDLIARRNVETRPVHARCPVSLFVGGLEPWHWIDQTYRYAHHLHREGLRPEVHVLPAYGHFDILDDFLQPDAPIGRALVQASLGR
ncbi:alpha/beta hydrolase [Mangrovicella endophytica]|uniref:alpha/beta hydrolase n=1 Tax=Mangrovicella endophytica TaxID=2066697 RepID=UPI000C9E174E|nr:alpha/beta hydrolase [Mangrovicella endophytica]